MNLFHVFQGLTAVSGRFLGARYAVQRLSPKNITEVWTKTKELHTEHQVKVSLMERDSFQIYNKTLRSTAATFMQQDIGLMVQPPVSLSDTVRV